MYDLNRNINVYHVIVRIARTKTHIENRYVYGVNMSYLLHQVHNYGFRLVHYNCLLCIQHKHFSEGLIGFKLLQCETLLYIPYTNVALFYSIFRRRNSQYQTSEWLRLSYCMQCRYSSDACLKQAFCGYSVDHILSI